METGGINIEYITCFPERIGICSLSPVNMKEADVVSVTDTGKFIQNA
jgi:hypothetical protein